MFKELDSTRKNIKELSWTIAKTENQKEERLKPPSSNTVNQKLHQSPANNVTKIIAHEPINNQWLQK
jgi:hypothetical protein